VSAAAEKWATSWLSGERKAILLGNAAAHHPQASSLLALAQFIGQHTGATVGYLGEAANTVGAQVALAWPLQKGLHAGQMLSSKKIKALLLWHTEPAHDVAVPSSQWQTADMVVTCSAFKTNLDISDVLLPIAPFTETPGTFINTEGRAQSFHAVVKPLGEARPGWKVLRVLGDMLGLQGLAFETIDEVRARSLPTDLMACLSNTTQASVDLTPATQLPVTASIYQLDPLVRRAPSLQRTADAHDGGSHGG
jgi:NADH-quinone oxidoreductase subunit G